MCALTCPRPARSRSHTGPAVTGVIGTRLPKFGVFGDTMNVASRMESTSRPGRIHISANTRDLLANEEWEATGGIAVKGKGASASCGAAS